MKACAVNDTAATDSSKITTAICRDQIRVCATSCDITSVMWFASPLTWLWRWVVITTIYTTFLWIPLFLRSEPILPLVYLKLESVNQSIDSINLLWLCVCMCYHPCISLSINTFKQNKNTKQLCVLIHGSSLEWIFVLSELNWLCCTYSRV